MGSFFIFGSLCVSCEHIRFQIKLVTKLLAKIERQEETIRSDKFAEPRKPSLTGPLFSYEELPPPSVRCLSSSQMLLVFCRVPFVFCSFLSSSTNGLTFHVNPSLFPSVPSFQSWASPACWGTHLPPALNSGEVPQKSRFLRGKF